MASNHQCLRSRVFPSSSSSSSSSFPLTSKKGKDKVWFGRKNGQITWAALVEPMYRRLGCSQHLQRSRLEDALAHARGAYQTSPKLTLSMSFEQQSWETLLMVQPIGVEQCCGHHTRRENGLVLVGRMEDGWENSHLPTFRPLDRSSLRGKDAHDAAIGRKSIRR